MCRLRRKTTHFVGLVFYVSLHGRMSQRKSMLKSMWTEVDFSNSLGLAATCATSQWETRCAIIINYSECKQRTFARRVTYFELNAWGIHMICSKLLYCSSLCDLGRYEFNFRTMNHSRVFQLSINVCFWWYNRSHWKRACMQLGRTKHRYTLREIFAYQVRWFF